MTPNYENTVSEIDIATFRETRRIPIAINLNQIVADQRGRLWISSRGDYFDTEAALYCYDTRKNRVETRLDLCPSSLWLDGSMLYVTGVSYAGASLQAERTYAVIDTDTGEICNPMFITDGSQTDIRIPYSVAVNPVSKEIYVTDARTYVNPGYLHCYSPQGVRQWSVRTGDIPAHFAFLPR